MATTTAPRQVAPVGRTAAGGKFAVRAALGRITGNYIVRRVFKAFFTIFFVTSLTFFVVRLMPGSPVDAYIAKQIAEYGVSYTDAAAQAQALFAINPSEPLYQQYFTYLGRLMQGNLGKSLVSSGAPVLQIILQYLPWTLFSVGLGLMIAYVLGVALGMAMAYRRESFLDHALSVVASLFHSIPNYLLAVMIIVFFGVRLGWLPLTKMRGSFSPGINPSTARRRYVPD